MVSSILAILSFLLFGYTVGSVRIIKEGNAALVERLGRYRGTLEPGLNFIVPLLDSVVLQDTMREQTLDIEPQSAITKDSVNLKVDAIIYWRIYNLERTYYAIEDVEFAMQELVITALRSEVGKMDFQSLFSSRETINRALLDVLDEATAPWGLKINRVEIQKLDPPQNVIDAMQQEKEADFKKRATILEAEATVKSMQLLSRALEETDNQREVLNYMLAQRYVEANLKLGESQNSKVLFMDPRSLTEGLVDLINEGDASNR